MTNDIPHTVLHTWPSPSHRPVHESLHLSLPFPLLSVSHPPIGTESAHPMIIVTPSGWYGASRACRLSLQLQHSTAQHRPANQRLHQAKSSPSLATPARISTAIQDQKLHQRLLATFEKRVRGAGRRIPRIPILLSMCRGYRKLPRDAPVLHEHMACQSLGFQIYDGLLVNKDRL